MKQFVLAIDFDGTIVDDGYPNIGELKLDAKYYINKLFGEGHWIIINTCRSGKFENDVIEFLNNNDIKFHEINRNLQHRIELYKRDCRKIGADIYIDDRNIECNGIIWKDIYRIISNKSMEK